MLMTVMVIIATTLSKTSAKCQVLYVISSCLPTTYNVGVMVCILQVRILRLRDVHFLVTCLVSQQCKGVGWECVPESDIWVSGPPLTPKSLIDLGQAVKLLQALVFLSVKWDCCKNPVCLSLSKWSTNISCCCSSLSLLLLFPLLLFFSSKIIM